MQNIQRMHASWDSMHMIINGLGSGRTHECKQTVEPFIYNKPCWFTSSARCRHHCSLWALVLTAGLLMPALPVDPEIWLQFRHISALPGNEGFKDVDHLCNACLLLARTLASWRAMIRACSRSLHDTKDTFKSST